MRERVPPLEKVKKKNWKDAIRFPPAVHRWLSAVPCVIEELHHRRVPAVIIYIYGSLGAIQYWGCTRHSGVQRRQYNVIYFYSTLSKFAVLLRKCCPSVNYSCQTIYCLRHSQKVYLKNRSVCPQFILLFIEML